MKSEHEAESEGGNRAGDVVIEFRHVSVSFDAVEALRGVSFRLARGEMIFLTGVSGSGKSVLMQVAMGLMRPDGGQALVEGRHIEDLSENELLAIRGGLMGMVFQTNALFTGMSVFDNVAYRPREHGWDEARTEEAVMEALAFVGLAEEVDNLPDELSGGMKQRLEIARALIGWPSIMLYDEPTSGLDPITATQILDLVIRARDVHQISSIYCTKQLDEIPYLANHIAVLEADGTITIRDSAGTLCPLTRVMLLDEGRIAWTGGVEEFRSSPLQVVTHMTHPEREAHTV